MNGPYGPRFGLRNSRREGGGENRARNSLMHSSTSPFEPFRSDAPNAASAEPGSSLFGSIPRSVSPDEFPFDLNMPSSDPFEDSPQPVKPRAKPSRPGAFHSSHDAISRKVAAFDNARSIEIAPGLSVRLRGAQETWAAVESDFYMPTTCICCSTDIFCIMDANYVICPVCKVVSPMEGCTQGMEGGAGLGFTMEDLQQWQGEIIRRNRQNHSGW